MGDIQPRKRFSLDEAREIGDTLGIDWSRIDVEQFRTGLDVELEHGSLSPQTDVTGDDPLLTGKIALAHLNEFSDYYVRLSRMEEQARFDHGPIGKTARAAGRVWGELEERTAAMRSSLDALEEKLDDLRKVGGEKWEAAKVDLEEARDGLKRSLEKLNRRVRGK